MRSFNAKAVGAVTTEVDVHVLVLAEDSDGCGMRLEIQGGPHDAQDVVLGMDTYCLCTETGACHYGGITHWEIDEREGCFRLLLDKTAARTLEVEDGFVIEIAPAYFVTVREAMDRIFKLSRFGMIRGHQQ